jgi:hypothetical protein
MLALFFVDRWMEALSRPKIFRTAADEFYITTGGILSFMFIVGLIIGVIYVADKIQSANRRRRLKARYSQRP